jgi:hypothetical protein
MIIMKGWIRRERKRERQKGKKTRGYTSNNDKCDN